MNKIYKVIWSKVKNQYVVVSELAHSNGKQSRTSRNSIRSRIAALVVCGAIAAFGFLGTSDVYAGTGDGATATTSQYVAIGSASYTDADNCNWNPGWFGSKYPEDYDPNKEYYQMIDNHKYIYTQTTAGNFWVREGYTIKINKDQRFPGTNEGIATVVETYKGEGADTEGILQSYQNVEKSMGITTLNKDTLYSTKTDMYVGAVNTPTTDIKSSNNRFYILRNGSWVNVGKDGSSSFSSNFNYTDVKYDKSTGLYTFHNEVVPTENLYVIDGNVGVFTTEAGGTEIYKGDVYGWNNEILVTGVDKEGKYTSYWGSENVDPNAPIGNMPISTLEHKFDVVNNSIRDVAGDNIKEIQVEKTNGTDGTEGGTIGLQTNGDYYDTGEKDENGNPIYAPMGGAKVPGAITITSEGGTGGDDVRIKFANEDGSFTVDAGSKVEGLNGTETATDGDTLTGIKINGEEYKLGGGETYTAGNGIAIDDENDNKISVRLKDGETNLTVDNTGLALSDNLNVASVTATNNIAANSMSVTNVDKTNDASVVNVGYFNTNEKHIAPTENSSYEASADGTVTLKYADGEGNEIPNMTAKITGLASDSELSAAAAAAKTEVVGGKNATVTANTEPTEDGHTVYTVDAYDTQITGDGNVSVTGGEEVDENNVRNYNVKLNDVITVGTSDKAEHPVIIDGTSGQVTGLTNTDLKVAGFGESNRAATEEQLKAAMNQIDEGSYKGWTVTTNGGKTEEDKAAVASNGTVDFSADDTNITIDQNGTNLKFGLADDLSVNKITTNNMYVTNVDNNNNSSVVNVGYFKDNEKHIMPTTGDASYVASEDGTVTLKYADGSGKEIKDTVAKITGLASDKELETATAAAKTEVTGGKNITVGEPTTASDGHSIYTVDLADNVYLGGDNTPENSNITLDGTNGVIEVGSNIALDGRGTAVIGGVNIDTAYDEATGKPSSTMTGLSNTTWTDEIATAAADKKSEAAGTAATQGQLGDVASDLSDQITNSGWTASTNNGAVTTDITNGDKVDFANTDGNIAVNQTAVKDDKGNITGTNLTFDLNPDITLDDDVEDGNSVQLSGTNGTINAHNSELIFGGTGKYDNVNDMTFNQNGLTITNTQTMRDTGETTTSSTVINGGSIATGNIIAGGITVNADNGGTVNGLTNKTWDADNYVSGQAATEDQLKSVSDKVNAGWVATDNNGNQITVNPKDNTLNFSGDRNVTVTANKEDGSIDVALNNEVQLGDFDNGTGVYLSGASGTISATNSISVGMDQGLVIDGNKKTINGLSNTTWDPENYVSGQAATEDQLQEAAAASKTTLSNGTNTNVTSTEKADGHIDYQVNLNKNINLNDRVYINGDPAEGNKTIVDIKSSDKSKEESIFAVEDKGNGSISIGGIDITNVDGPYLAVGDGKLKFYKDGGLATGNETGTFSVRPDGDLEISGKNSSFNVDAETGNVNAVNSSGSAIMMNDDSVALNASGNGVAISDEGILLNTNGIDEDIKLVTKGTSVSVDNDGATFTNTNTNETTNIDGGTINVGDRLMVEENGSIYATNNNGSTVMINDNGVALNSEGNGVVVSGEGITLNTNGSAVTVDRFNGATFTNTNTTESTNINGANITAGEGENQIKINGAPKADDPALSVGTDKFVVGQDGSLSVSDKFNVDAETGNINAVNSNGSAIMMNDDSVALNASGNGVAISNEGITLNANGSAVTVDRFNGTTFTNTNTGETTNINGDIITTDTVKGLSNTTWDDELAKQVANSEELQGTAATQGQLQQAVSEVSGIVNKGWTAKAGDNDGEINITPGDTLNFEGDGNITVSATSGTSSELKFGLNHNITLNNVENEKTMMVFNTDGREGYIPDNYKEDNGQINDFIEEHGGFAIYYANPSLTTGDMTGTFGVTTDGVVHAKDVISYYSASGGSQSDVIRYSLNDVGDIVTQISHAVFDEGKGSTGMEYTLISDFEDEAEKDSPFKANEGKTRTIGLAVRQDGAVIVGAVVNDEGMSSDYGIRINAETDADGNNKATITGLENTEWKPPTPVATLAANDGSATVTSRAATESQLNDLYSAVAAYDVNVDGTIDYSHIALAGAPYGASRAGNGTPTGGTSITNVAYASGKDGSEAVNVDYLNDAISDAVEKGGVVSETEKHLATNSGTKPDGNATYAPDADGNITISEVNGDGTATGNSVVISDVASKEDLDNLKDDVGDLDYSKVEGDTIIDGDSVTTAIGKLDNKIENISGTATDADNNTVTGGKINSDGTISLTQKDKDSIKLEGQLTDSGVVQEGTSFDKETGTITITSQDKYSGETSSVKVEGIASTEVVGATNKEDLATAYKDADKDGNATTEYITDSESMVEADVALDHAIQDVANTSYANDMVLSNRIDSVEKRLGNVEERIDKVGAMAAAIANLRTMGFDPEAPTEIAIGVGQYKSETGIAIGVFHYPNQDFMLSASLSSSGDELMGGIGATWKLGRKSAAERAKDEEARHLEQAEEMKKLAQQEKVKAQAQRHAKLLAERQQASQKNA